MWLCVAASTAGALCSVWAILRRLARGPRDPAAKVASGDSMEISLPMLTYLVLMLTVMGYAFAQVALHGPSVDPDPPSQPDFSRW